MITLVVYIRESFLGHPSGKEPTSEGTKIQARLSDRTCTCSVAQSWVTLCDPMDCRPPGSSVCGIFQSRILEWLAISFSRTYIIMY